MIWVTSDLHLNHNNILLYEKESRAYSNIDEMNNSIIDNINEEVYPEDELYILGDICFGSKDNAIELLEKIACQNVTVIYGNHDSQKVRQMLRELGWNVYKRDYIKYENTVFWLSHKPEKPPVNAVNLYGHLHSSAPVGYSKKENSYHVGLDTCGMYPVSLDYIIYKMEAKNLID